jgi:flavin reductase
MGSVPAAVTVITANHKGERNGLTATAVCSVSAEPAQLLICVNRDASANVLIEQSGRFAVSYLHSDHQDVSRIFSQSKLGEGTRFGVGTWKETASGALVLFDAIAYFDCEVVSHQYFGTHSVFVGKVVEAETLVGDPLVYHGRSYRRLA